KVLRQFIKIILNVPKPAFVKQQQTLLKPVKERGRPCTAFPRQCVPFEHLFAIFKIPRRFDAYPADMGRFDAVAGAVGNIKNSAAFRGTEPFVAGAGSNVHELRRHIVTARAEALDNIDREESIDRTGRTAYPFE